MFESLSDKLSGVFKKKRSFFRKKQIEAIQVYLLFIGLDLGKIRIVGKIQCQTGRNGIFSVKTKFCIRFRTIQFAATTRTAQGIRSELEIFC